MTVEMYQTASIVCYVIAAIALVVAVSLFFRFKIVKVFADLTGKTERKAVEAIRLNTGTQKSTHSIKTAKIPAVQPNITQEIDTSCDTMVSENTTVLDNTTVLNKTASLDETTVLNETTVLGCNHQMIFEDEIIYIHTNEIIV